MKMGKELRKKAIDIVCKWEKKKDRRDTSVQWDTVKRKEDKDRVRNFDRRRATMRLIKTQIRDETYNYIQREMEGELGITKRTLSLRYKETGREGDNTKDLSLSSRWRQKELQIYVERKKE